MIIGWTGLSFIQLFLTLKKLIVENPNSATQCENYAKPATVLYVIPSPCEPVYGTEKTTFSSLLGFGNNV